MSDAPASYKCSRTETPASKSGDSASAKKATSPRRTDGGSSVHSCAGAIKIAHSKSGNSSILRGVFGRRWSNQQMQTNEDNQNPRFEWSVRKECPSNGFLESRKLSRIMKGYLGILSSQDGGAA